MGHGITIHCESCDYYANFILGIGMMYSSLERVISEVSPARREKVKNLLQRKDIQSVDYEHKLFICPKCNNLAQHFDFSITYNQGQVYQPYFRCPTCHMKLVPLEEPVTSTPCPECGQLTLVEEMTMLWD